MRSFVVAAILAATTLGASPRIYHVEATAYCSCEKCCGKWADGITKIGTKAKSGHTVAVDPRVFPLGSCLRIDSRHYRAEDIGGAIRGHRIDIFHDTHEEALEFGRKKLVVTLC